SSDIARLADAFGRDGARTRRLVVSHAFHSPLMEPMLDGFEQAARAVTFGAPRVPIVSNVTGQVAAADEIGSAAYWRRHVRQPVRFEAGVRTLEARGIDLMVEIGPHPTLTGLAAACLPPGAATFVASLKKGQDDWRQLLSALASVYQHGATIDWNAFTRGTGGQRIALPTYPFERSRCWAEVVPPSGTRTRAGAGHPLLGRELRSPALADRVFEAFITPDAGGWLKDHLVLGRVIVPGAALLEMALSAARPSEGGSVRATDVVVLQPLVVPDEGVTVQVVLRAAPGRETEFTIYSAPGVAGRSAAWASHASGRVGAGSAPNPLAPSAGAAVSREGELPASALYDRFRAAGIALGSSFEVLGQVRPAAGEAWGHVSLRGRAASEPYCVHPLLLDGAIQLAGAALLPQGGEAEDVYLPFSFEEVWTAGWAGRDLRGHARLRGGAGTATVVADVDLFDEHGELRATLRGLCLRRADRAALAAEAESPDDWLYQSEWRRTPLPEPASAAPLPAAADLALAIGEQLPAIATETGTAAFDPVLADLDGLALAYIDSAFREMGLPLTEGLSFTTSEASERLHLAPKYARLLDRLLDVLHERGVLRCTGSRWTCVAPPSGPAPEGRLRAALDRAAPNTAELEIVGRCGPALADVLRGRRDPLGLLFPGGSFDAAERMYRDSPGARAFNALVREAAAFCVAGAGGRRLRVLEVGGGTAATTSHVLPALPDDRVEYVFSDLSPAFTRRAEERFGGRRGFQARPLDVERDPEAQGFEPGGFDLVIASNVVHATASLARSLGNLRRLLRPGGLLLLLEMTVPQAWIDITFGLTDGWWLFEDTDFRTGGPLASVDAWRRVLADAGFGQAAAVAGDGAQGILGIQSLLMATAVSPAPEAGAAAPWLILADDDGIGRAAANLLRAGGDRALVVTAGVGGRLAEDEFRVDPDRPADWASLLAAHFLEPGACPGVVYLWALDQRPPAWESTDSLIAGGRASTSSLVSAFQALAGRRWSAPPPIWIVTRGAQPVDAGKTPVDALQACAWGIGRTLALEHPEWPCARLDLDPDEPAAAAAGRVVGELRAKPGDDEIGYRGSERFVGRLVRYRPAERIEWDAEAPKRLVAERRGTFDTLAWKPCERVAPGPGQVEIEVTATGLNFKDVMNALGTYPGEAGPLGSECAGRIVRTGSGVRPLDAGDRIVAVAAGAFSRYVIADARMASRIPAHLSDEEAATMPVAYVTAWFALRHLGEVKRGDTVLVHAAAGGVGLAAVHLAQRAGAEVFATAGTDAKREYLRRLGVRHVFSSRSLDFAEGVLAATNGRGVDIVLNSLAGDFIARSFAVTAAEGRFLELGKRDLWTDDQVASLGRAIKYFIIDWGQTSRSDPALVAGIFQEIARLAAEGALAPLPRRTFPASEAVNAFRFMAQARHTGKIVVTQPAGATDRGAVVRADAAYLVTGGLGGLGLLVAGWLAARGARHLVLAGRRAPSAEAAASIAAMERAGVRVDVVRADVSVPGDVERMVEVSERDGRALAGIVHCAGVLDPGVLERLDAGHMERVLAPKVLGTWLLHRRTLGTPLDFFVMFSSIGSVFGAPGQANHAAANAFLDAFAFERCRRGLAAQSIAWGAWSEVGAAVRHAAGGRAAQQGMGVISPASGLAVLQKLMAEGVPHVTVAPQDWSEFARRFGERGLPERFADVRAEHAALAIASSPREAAVPAFRAAWNGAAPAARPRVLRSEVERVAAKVLGLPPGSSPDPRQPLHDLGLDSLMAVELRNALGAAIERPLPATLLFDHPTIDALVAHLGTLLAPEGQPAPGGPPSGAALSATSQVLAGIDGLSEEEVERLLTERSGGGDQG
ncbi:MAG: SDR family NAD(P)-dependent oxidoreductase, partial [Acidobacteria bacterium]|nr:SDR family NAD(P)-dependent oxidoreductase [Acidobacteriota bacterium]